MASSASSSPAYGTFKTVAERLDKVESAGDGAIRLLVQDSDYIVTSADYGKTILWAATDGTACAHLPAGAPADATVSLVQFSNSAVGFCNDEGVSVFCDTMFDPYTRDTYAKITATSLGGNVWLVTGNMMLD